MPAQRTLLPVLDPTEKISILPASLRFHQVGRHEWALASVNGEDFVTVGCSSRREARIEAWVRGNLYRVAQWAEVELEA
jgi:hypothetical protein